VSISQLVRIACGTVGISSSIRVLALNDPKKALPELEELQIAFLHEAEEPILLYCLRGERAIMNLSMENVENGKFRKYVLAHPDKDISGNVPLPGEDWLFRGVVSGDHALGLEMMTKEVSAAKLPAHQQIGAMNEIDQEWRSLYKDSFGWIRYRMTALMAPAMEKLTVAAIRYRANLLTAAVAIACERYRLTRGRWPTSLDELPKELLAVVPTDPFNGEPINLVKLEDGIAIVSVGVEQHDLYGKKTSIGPLGGDEIGWRLFDPDQRGLPPFPRPQKEKDPLEPW
jgi:hypothetical protein